MIKLSLTIDKSTISVESNSNDLNGLISQLKAITSAFEGDVTSIPSSDENTGKKRGRKPKDGREAGGKKRGRKRGRKPNSTKLNADGSIPKKRGRKPKNYPIGEE